MEPSVYRWILMSSSIDYHWNKRQTARVHGQLPNPKLDRSIEGNVTCVVFHKTTGLRRLLSRRTIRIELVLWGMDRDYLKPVACRVVINPPLLIHMGPSMLMSFRDFMPLYCRNYLFVYLTRGIIFHFIIKFNHTKYVDKKVCTDNFTSCLSRQIF